MIVDAREREYSTDEIVDLLTKAQKLGFSLDKGSEIERLTVAQLDQIVNTRQ